MTESLDGLIHGVAKNYSNLLVLQPKHELLRYFVLDGEMFRFTSDSNLRTEFMQRFGSVVSPVGFPTFSDYQKALAQKSFSSYVNALEEAVKKFIEE